MKDFRHPLLQLLRIAAGLWVLGMSSSVTALNHEATHEDLVVEAARALDLRSALDYDEAQFHQLTEVQNLERLIRSDIEANRGRETVLLLREWEPSSLVWETAANTILFRMEGWPTLPIEESDMGVMVDLFKASVRKGDSIANYDVPRGRIGSPYTFRSRLSVRLGQALNLKFGYLPNDDHLWEDPLRWLDSEILSKTGALPSVIGEHRSSKEASITNPRPSKIFDPPAKVVRAEGSGGVRSGKWHFWIVVGGGVSVLLLGFICFRKKLRGN